MPDLERQILYKVKLDKASHQSALKALYTQHREETKQLSNAKQLVNLNQDARKALLSQVDAQKKIAKAQQQSTKEVKLQVRELDRLNERFDQVSRDVGLAGDTQANLGALRGLTGVAGLQGVSGGLDVAGEIIVLAEELPRLKASLEGLPQVAKLAVSEIGGKGLALIGALGALTVALALASAEAQRRAQLARVVIDSQKEYFQIVQTGTTESIQSGKESAQIALDVAKQELERRKAQREAINKDIGELTGVFQGVVQLGISAGVTGGEVKELDAEIQSLEKTVLENELAVGNYEQALKSAQVAQNDATQALLASVEGIGSRGAFLNQITKNSYDQNIELNQSLLEQNDILAQQINAIRQSGDTSADATKALEGYYAQLQANDEQLQLLRQTGIPYTRQLAEEAEQKAKLEEQAKKQERDRAQVAKQRESSLSKLVSLEDQANNAIASFADKQAELVADRQLRDARELEDHNAKIAQEQVQHNQDLLKISRDGNARIIEAQQAVRDLDKDFMKGQIKSQSDYNDELRKLNRRRDLEEIQDRRQHLFSLAEATQDNDAIAFLRLQKRHELEQRTDKENETLEDKERRETLQKELAEQRTAFLERRALLLQEVTERRNQLQQAIAESRNKFAMEQQLEQQAFDKAQARQAQDDAIADQKAQQALQKTLNGINVKAQAELTAISQVTSAVGSLEAVARRIMSLANSGGSSNRANTSSYLTGSIGSKSYEIQNRLRQQANVYRASGDLQAVARTGFAFAKGGIVDRPTLAMIGEGNRPEAVIPFKKSEGIMSALQDYGLRGSNRGGVHAPIQLNFAPNLTVGDIASGADVTQALQQFSNELERQLQGALYQAVNQTA